MSSLVETLFTRVWLRQYSCFVFIYIYIYFHYFRSLIILWYPSPFICRNLLYRSNARNSSFPNSTRPNKSKSTDVRCPYCKAKAVPPTRRNSPKHGICIRCLRSSRVWGSIVRNDSIDNPFCRCASSSRYSSAFLDSVYAMSCRQRLSAAALSSFVSNTNRSIRRVPARAPPRQRGSGLYRTYRAQCPRRGSAWTVLWLVQVSSLQFLAQRYD